MKFRLKTDGWRITTRICNIEENQMDRIKEIEKVLESYYQARETPKVMNSIEAGIIKPLMLAMAALLENELTCLKEEERHPLKKYPDDAAFHPFTSQPFKPRGIKRIPMPEGEEFVQMIQFKEKIIVLSTKGVYQVINNGNNLEPIPYGEPNCECPY